ncbi:MAG: preprotein translocase subunit SecY [Clostridia bacterium]|nr:preprotein translocase subunit SecY [Clostridia bacterium]
MFKTIANAWKLADLRQKILYVIFIVFLYRIGTAIPVPFVNPDMLSQFMNATEGSIFQYLSILSGNAFSQATLFALGISPYITASIVIQLLTIAIPYLENKSKEGEEGKKWLNQLTRIVTVVLGIITAIGYFQLLNANDVLNIPDGYTLFAAIVIVACYCSGSALVMWLAEKVNENGIGNGISIILFANIVSSTPSMISSLWSQFIASGNVGKVIVGIVVAIVSIASIFFIVFITDSERKLPVQYAKKVVGRKMYGGQSSTLPLKLNMTGVMPIIFANSIVTLPSTISMFLPSGSVKNFLNNWFGTDSVIYAVLTFILIIAFAYFYVTISFNPIEVANNLKKNGGFIPGIRPGKPTSDYITKVLNRITLIGALFLDVIAVLPIVANIISKSQLSALAFTGSSVIIIVGVVLETAREIESQMTMRHYKGFLE